MLVLSEYVMHSGDGAAAASLLERALFCCERSFHPLFNVNSGTCRLAFRRAENRPFFLSLFKHIVSLTRKGCWRTAMEFAKFLYSLDPVEDPYCALQMLDYFALRAGEYDYVLALYKALEPRLSLLPNWVFASALARFHLEAKAHASHTLSTAALQEALLKFPQTVGPLLDHCKSSISVSQPLYAALGGEGLSPADFSLRFHISLFVERSNSLWKEPDTLDWWRQVAKDTHALIQKGDSRVARYQEMRQAYPEVTINLYRHVLVCGKAAASKLECPLCLPITS